MQPINTVFSTDSKLEIPELLEAKKILIEEYGSRYSVPNVHITYSIVPFPEDNFEKGRKDLLEYASNLKPFTVKLTDLIINQKSNFIYVKVEGENLKKNHENMTNLLNEYRDGYVREKDLDRLNNGDFDDKQKEYLEKYGYMRVMDLYNSHITIGNCDEDTDMEALEKRLREVLGPVLNKEIVIDNVRGLFHTDSKSSQSEMRVLWEEKILL